MAARWSYRSRVLQKNEKRHCVPAAVCPLAAVIIGNAKGGNKMQSRNFIKTICLAALMAVPLVPLRAQEPQKRVPNIFTPNGDGINDNITLQSTQAMLFIVYNRDGGEVFRGEGKLIVWDGLNQRGQKIANGIYFYVLHDPDNAYAEGRGFIYLSTDKNTQAPPAAGSEE